MDGHWSGSKWLKLVYNSSLPVLSMSHSLLSNSGGHPSLSARALLEVFEHREVREGKGDPQVEDGGRAARSPRVEVVISIESQTR